MKDFWLVVVLLAVLAVFLFLDKAGG